jgi:isopenicillin-N N-acyltransferase like protein
MISKPSVGQAVNLSGTPYDRGVQQARIDPKSGPAVFSAIMNRVEQARSALADASDFLAAQWAFTAAHALGQLEQIHGIADGFGIEVNDLFAYLHLGVIEDGEGLPSTEEDGCSVLACDTRADGPLLAKNRDYRGEHRALQRVFLENDPSWGARSVLSVGSLGSPGAFSSGMNSDGLALADTRIGWRRPGTGWLRYLLMNEILIRTTSVTEAIAYIRSQPHVGGGSLVLADAYGNKAAVELASDKVFVDRSEKTCVGRTNHFLARDLKVDQTRSTRDPNSSNSEGRLDRIDHWQRSGNAGTRSLETLVRLLGYHAIDDEPALCRHGENDGSQTISTTLFACKSRRLYFCPGNPCVEHWRTYAF